MRAMDDGTGAAQDVIATTMITIIAAADAVIVTTTIIIVAADAVIVMMTIIIAAAVVIAMTIISMAAGAGSTFFVMPSNGYSEGSCAESADCAESDRYNFRDEGAYRDATIGYRSDYGSVDFYCHSFREGFQRGYLDGYLNRGSRGGALGDILGGV